MSTANQSGLRILVVDDEINIRKTLSTFLETEGHQVVAVSDPIDALAESGRTHFDMAFIDLRLKNTSGVDLIPDLLAQSPWIRAVMMTAHASVDTAVETMKRGAVDYITKPFTAGQLRRITDLLTRQSAVKHASQENRGGQSSTNLSSENPAMQRVIALAMQVAHTDAPVLIRGESGTGKGVLARAIHENGNRAEKTFAALSCSALSPQLLETELFRAVENHPGGTLFLDDINNFPLDLQPRLTRFVQDGEYQSETQSIPKRANLRLLTATNADLEDAVAEGRFRKELLYRINVIQIDIPSLRQRPEDVVALADHFIDEFKLEKPIDGLTQPASDALRAYPWPGNVRELRNVIERAVVLCHGGPIGLEHLPTAFSAHAAPDPEVGAPVALEKLEETHIRRVLARAKSLDEAARVLQMDPATLWRRRKKYGI